MNGALFRASGVDANEGAKTVFVWRHDAASNKFRLLASGRIMEAAAVPPGAPPGQFGVTFMLPEGCSFDSIVVTDDKNNDKFLPSINFEPVSELPAQSSVVRKQLRTASDGTDRADRPIHSGEAL
jgi:hypothetical protein